MISLEEIKEKQEELNKMIEEYSKKDLKWNKDWKPKEDDTYFCIDSYNDVMSYSCDNDSLCEKHIKYNRTFQTREQAEKWLEIDTYLREKSFEPDWNNNNQKKYSLYYDYFYKRFYFDINYTVDYFNKFYFETEEIKEEILEKYTTEELEFYFNIGE